MTRKVEELSEKVISKFTAWFPESVCARHSITKLRRGALPLTLVKMPSPAVDVVRSSQYGAITDPRVAVGSDVLLKAAELVSNFDVHAPS